MTLIKKKYKFFLVLFLLGNCNCKVWILRPIGKSVTARNMHLFSFRKSCIEISKKITAMKLYKFTIFLLHSTVDAIVAYQRPRRAGSTNSGSNYDLVVFFFKAYSNKCVN